MFAQKQSLMYLLEVIYGRRFPIISNHKTKVNVSETIIRKGDSYLLYKRGSGIPGCNTIGPDIVFCPFTSQILRKLIHRRWV
jgi:hypothetical protein